MMQYYCDVYGFDICDADIAHYLNVALCLTTKELSKQWREQLGIDT